MHVTKGSFGVLDKSDLSMFLSSSFYEISPPFVSRLAWAHPNFVGVPTLLGFFVFLVTKWVFPRVTSNSEESHVIE